MDARQQFIEDYLAMIVSQRQAIGVHKWSPDAQHLYDVGVRTATACVLSLTDSRQPNGSRHRLTDLDGTVIEFYPAGEDVAGDFRRGIIVEITERYQAMVDGRV